MTDMNRYWVTDVDLYDSTDDGSHQPEARFGVDYADIEVVLAADAEAVIAAAERKGGPEHIDAMLNRAYEEGFESGERDMLAKCIALLSQERDKWFALLEDTARRSEYHNMSWHRCQDLINRISSDMSLLEELQEKP